MPPIVAAVGAVIGAVGTVVGTVGSFVAGLGFIGQALVGVGLNIAVGYLQQSLSGKQKKQPGGVKFEREYGTAVQRQVGCGTFFVSGHDTYVNAWGPSNYE